ncbi:MAG TPA: tetratricopeptide repeat protein [Bryobacteraceae bacterium]|nr:tetratricopeptide repeat protein [Bryobacteraceae bacterium]
MKVRCRQLGCRGTIEDGYCNICGLAAAKGDSAPSSPAPSSSGTGAGSSPRSRTSGSRRTRHASTRTHRQLGAGLITLPELPSTDPEKAVLIDPVVPENKRSCTNCGNVLRREAGFCGKCGQKYSFVPTLKPGDLVAAQYEVKGALAYGGLGWIYLGFDTILARYVVLKGLLNVHDESSAAAAVAERKFLAAVKHPNIVGIYNFVQHGAEGFIVMEYVGGKTIKQIRQERGPLPPAEALAYIHRILGAFAFLHRQGFVYCDFKPDNIMLEKDDVKLIDLGGVRRLDDPAGDIYGTVGYSAPEASQGPTVASDLFTIGRTLAVLVTTIHGFSKEHRYTLPTPVEEPLFAQQESVYRLLLKATAEKPDDRFESADAMADQTLGVLREIVATETHSPRPAPSAIFGSDLVALDSAGELEPVLPDPLLLPTPGLDTEDPAARQIANAGALVDRDKRIAALRQVQQQVPASREVRLRLAAELAGGRYFEASEKLLNELEREDPWDWRVLWYQGRRLLLQRNPQEAQKIFDQVYFDLPGELAPKLALGLSAELAHNFDLAIKMYGLVCATDPGIVSAAFGLARCYNTKGDRHSAVKALERISPGSALYPRARVESARILIGYGRNGNNGANGRPPASIRPALTDLAEASSLCESLTLEGAGRHILNQQVLRAALDMLTSKRVAPNSSVKVLGRPLQETRVREALERNLRTLARMANGEERIRLVDEANRIRPWTFI